MNSPSTHSPEFILIPANRQKTLICIVTFLTILPTSTLSQNENDSSYFNKSSDSVTKFEPSLAIVIGALSIVFSLTFVALIYAKFCHISTSFHHEENLGNLSRTRSRLSGIDKAIIESLPFFKFSTLKGWKQGLECSVCLSTFEDVEVLRLLPKCKHVFHIDCIDQWLEKHTSCPLCRFEVVKEDIALFMHSNSLRFNVSESSNLGLFIEREGSSRFGTYIENDQDELNFHKFNHRIMICDDHDPMMLKTRWSNVNSSDLLFLKSEMITCVSSDRFDNHLSLEIEGGDRETEDEAVEFGGRRSVSEITVHPRFLEGEVRVEDERLRRLWLPIARKTVEQFANRKLDYVSEWSTTSK
ncbi:E3 ubiquitin-protein ligase ATL42-like [Rutidosis leptorrhynchoides]|uniref:E3 ubiquitin-protein ligase ATL42-like n=1 Tax=Rutidosis leptorrhynchoides TaxID=125765 RepID=UPI003A99A9DE